MIQKEHIQRKQTSNRGAMSYRFHIRLEKQDKIQLLNRKHIDEFEGTLVA
jgi:hypothetical protein